MTNNRLFKRLAGFSSALLDQLKLAPTRALGPKTEVGQHIKGGVGWRRDNSIRTGYDDGVLDVTFQPSNVSAF